jgi:hypothetical protein
VRLNPVHKVVEGICAALNGSEHMREIELRILPVNSFDRTAYAPLRSYRIIVARLVIAAYAAIPALLLGLAHELLALRVQVFLDLSLEAKLAIFEL